MTAVFLGFVSDPDVVVKTIGLGLASAILIDVLVVRMVVAPAVMALLGDRAWGLPAGSTGCCRGIALEGEEPCRRSARSFRREQPLTGVPVRRQGHEPEGGAGWEVLPSRWCAALLVAPAAAAARR